MATSQVANPIETAQAAEIAGALATSKALNIIYETKESFTEISGWIQAGTSDVEAGPWIQDCRLAFTARAHGIRKILTENTSDFEDFEFIEAIDPFHADGDQAGPFTER